MLHRCIMHEGILVLLVALCAKCPFKCPSAIDSSCCLTALKNEQMVTYTVPKTKD